jgi:hypothetical protein
MKKTMKIFVATPKNMSAYVAVEIVQELENVFPMATVCTASHEFAEHYDPSNGFDGWTDYVVLGQDFMTRSYHYDVIIMPVEEIGKGNASIVRLALRNKRQILVRVKEREYHLVTGLQTLDEDNWQTGWRVQYTGRSSKD